MEKHIDTVINKNYNGPSKSVLDDKLDNQVKVLEQNISVKLVNWPDFERFKKAAPYLAFATWETRPVEDTKYDEERENAAVKKILNREVIPSTQETLQFTFEISGMTYIEVCRLIRRRSFAFQARCTGDSSIFNNDIIIPANIKGTQYEEPYVKLCKEQTQLYYDMIQDGVSVMDARYIAPKSLSQTYYFTCKWNDLITFVDSYDDMYVNDCIDAIIAFKVVQELCMKAPQFIKNYHFNLQKSPKVAEFMHAKGECSDLFLPEDWYKDEFEWKESDFLYQRQRTNCVAGNIYFIELEKTKKMIKEIENEN